MSTTLVSIKSIVPDVNQPRKYFDAAKLATLKKSITKHGIVSPLIVEKHDNEYLIVDGERRFRAATELGLREVPVTVVTSRDGVTRLIEQFHIQEMHEGWTPMEKAGVIAELCDEMKKPFNEVCDMLGLSPRTTQKYMALGRVVAKNEFSSQGLSLEFAEPLVSLSAYVKTLKNKELEEVFNLTDQKKLEKQVIKNITDGNFAKPSDITKLKDTFRSNPKMIEMFIDGADAETLYIKSRAKAAGFLRNAVNCARGVNTNVIGFMSRPDVKMNDSDIKILRASKKALTELLALAGQE